MDPLADVPLPAEFEAYLDEVLGVGGGADDGKPPSRADRDDVPAGDAGAAAAAKPVGARLPVAPPPPGSGYARPVIDLSKPDVDGPKRAGPVLPAAPKRQRGGGKSPEPSKKRGAEGRAKPKRREEEKKGAPGDEAAKRVRHGPLDAPSARTVRRRLHAAKKKAAIVLCNAGVTAALAPHSTRCYYIPEELGPRRPFRPGRKEPCTPEDFVYLCPRPVAGDAAYGYASWDAAAVAQECVWHAPPDADPRHVLGAALCELRDAGGDLPLVRDAHYFTGHRRRHEQASRQLNIHRLVLQGPNMALRVATYQMPFRKDMKWAKPATFAVDPAAGHLARLHLAELYLPLPQCTAAHNEYRQSRFVLLVRRPAEKDPDTALRQWASAVFLPGRTWKGSAEAANQRAVLGLDPPPEAVRHSVLFSHGRRDVSYAPAGARMFAQFRAWAYAGLPRGKDDAQTVPGLVLFSEAFAHDSWDPEVEDESGCLLSHTRVGIAARLVPVVLALRHMHARGFVHRCVTPDSVKCCAADGAWVLTNMAHVKRIGEPVHDDVPGTECYAPFPRPDTARPEHDLYMLAGLVYRVLSNTDPYAADNMDTQNVTAQRQAGVLARVRHQRLREIREERASGAARIDWTRLETRAKGAVARLVDWAKATLSEAANASLDALLDLLVHNFGGRPRPRFIGNRTAKKNEEAVLVDPRAGTARKFRADEMKSLPWPRDPEGGAEQDRHDAARLKKHLASYTAAMVGPVVPPDAASGDSFLSVGGTEPPLLLSVPEEEWQRDAAEALPDALLDAIVAGGAAASNDVWAALQHFARSAEPIDTDRLDRILA